MKLITRVCLPTLTRPEHVRAGVKLCVALAALSTLDARADPTQWGGGVGYASRNLYRGLSLSGAHGAWIVDVHHRWDTTLLAGLSAVEVDSPDRSPSAQWIAYGNWVVPVNDRVRLIAGLSHYAAMERDHSYGLRYDEINLAAQLDDRFSLQLSYTPNLDLAVHTVQSAAVDGVFRQPLYGGASFTAGLGYMRNELADSGYRYGHLGLEYVHGRYQGSLLYAATDAHARDELGSVAYLGWVASVLVHF